MQAVPSPDSGSSDRSPCSNDHRFAHRHPPVAAELLVDEHEPIGRPLPGTLASILMLFDRAIDERDIETARQLGRLLPTDLASDPAVLDRLATLHLVQGEIQAARDLLDRSERSSPRLDLLRAIAALEEGDVVETDRLLALPHMERSVALTILGTLLHSIDETDHGPRVRSDATVGVCRAAAEAGLPAAVRPIHLRRAVRALGTLLTRVTDRATIIGAVAAGLRGVAVDLGLDAGEASGGLAITTDDRRRIGLRPA